MIVNDDMIEKICFIEVYGQKWVDDLVTEYHFENDPKTWNLKEIGRRVKLNSEYFKNICKEIISAYENGSEVKEIISGNFSNTNASALNVGSLTEIIGVGSVSVNSVIKPTSVPATHRAKIIMWKLDMYDVRYTYPLYKYGKIRENSFSEIEWKLDALRIYLTTDRNIITSILSENEDKLEDFRIKRAETIHQQEEAYAKSKKECEILIEQNKIKERERKKALKEEARRRMALEAKMESHEIYGEILYRGEMFTIRSREDLEQFMQRMS